MSSMEQLFVTLGIVHKHSLVARQDDAGGNTSETASTASCSSPVNISGPSCTQATGAFYAIIVIQTLVAVAAIFILCAIQRRVKLYPNFCWGYPGIAIPVNMLGTTRFRFIYAIIFGVMSFQFFTALISGASNLFPLPENKYAQIIVSTFYSLGYVLLLTFLHYPFLATVDSGIPLVGLTIGAIYSTLWLVYTVFQLTLSYIGCTTGCVSDPLMFFITLLGIMPVLLAYVGIVLWFIVRLAQEIYRLIRSRKPFLVKLREKPAETYHQSRVCFLLKGKRAQAAQKTWRKLLNKVYPYEKSFHFPLHFLIAMTATFFVVVATSAYALVYVIAISTTFGNYRTSILNTYDQLDLTDLAAAFNISAADVSTFQEEYLTPLVRLLADTLLGFSVVLPTGTFLAIVFIFVMLLLMYRSIGQNIRLASRGDRSFLTLKKPPLYRSLDATIKYIGFQIAYFLWALFLYLATALLAGFVIVIGGIFLSLFPAFILDYILPLLIGFVWSQVIFWGQIIACWLFFTKKDGDTVHIHNRRLYSIIAYILLYQNAFVGFFSAILRVLKSVLFGFIVLTRLDRVLYMKGFERFDSAHRTFVGFLTLDLALNNSVMHVFCQLLLERRKPCEDSSSSSNSDPGNYHPVRDHSSSPDAGQDQKKAPYSQRAYNRWMKAYTLIRNPTLIETTRQKREEKELQSSLAFREIPFEMVTL